MSLRAGSCDVDALRVVHRGDADEHAGAAAVELVGGNARVLERLPRHFEQQALLRIEPAASRGEMPKNAGLEAVDVVEEAAGLGAATCRAAGIGIVVGLDVPAVGRHFADHVAALGQQLPVARRRRRRRREYGSAMPTMAIGSRPGGFGRVEPRLQALDRGERVLQHRAAVAGRSGRTSAVAACVSIAIHALHSLHSGQSLP